MEVEVEVEVEGKLPLVCYKWMDWGVLGIGCFFSLLNSRLSIYIIHQLCFSLFDAI